MRCYFELFLKIYINYSMFRSFFIFVFYLLNCITDILNIINNHCYRSAAFVHYMHIHNSKKDWNILNNIIIKYCTNTVWYDQRLSYLRQYTSVSTFSSTHKMSLKSAWWLYIKQDEERVLRDERCLCGFQLFWTMIQLPNLFLWWQKTTSKQKKLCALPACANMRGKQGEEKELIKLIKI